MLIKEACFFVSKPAVADASFFCLETKEPKVQAFRIASGRNAALRTWVVTLQMALLDGSFVFTIFYKPD